MCIRKMVYAYFVAQLSLNRNRIGTSTLNSTGVEPKRAGLNFQFLTAFPAESSKAEEPELFLSLMLIVLPFLSTRTDRSTTPS